MEILTKSSKIYCLLIKYLSTIILFEVTLITITTTTNDDNDNNNK